MIIARNQQHTAMLRGACMIHVLEHVTAAINAGTFAVPKRKHAIIFGRTHQTHSLRAPDCGGGEVFVDARYKFHVVCI